VVAGSGVAIAKHGNRSFTSQCGSADVLESLGLNVKVKPAAVQDAIEQVGVGFMFAPTFHPAMRHAFDPRREIGIRTVFNVLGPLTNPAGATAQILGVYDERLTAPLAHALKGLGCEEAMVVHGLDGLDEISTIGKTVISWLREGVVRTVEMVPKDFGVKKARIEELSAKSRDENAETLFKILNGHRNGDDCAKRDIVLVNAAAGIIVGAKAEDFNRAMEIASESIDSGAAYNRLKALVKVSGGNLSKLEELETKYA
jgi:anthranilate phosphoribosyltransferase